MNREVFIRLLNEKEFMTIKKVSQAMNAVDLAELFSDISEKELVLAFRLIDKEKAAETFAYMDSEQREVLLNLLSDREIKEMMDAMFTDDTVDMIEEMPANIVTRILRNLNEDSRAAVNEILKYPKDSAGSIMTIEYISFHPQTTVKEALHKIKTVGIHKETIYTCYITQGRHLLGIVTAKELMTNEDDVRMKDIMEQNVIKVYTHDDKEDVAKIIQRYGVISVPVVDGENCIVGIVTFDDAIDVISMETEEDISKMAAMSPIEEAYFKTSVWEHAKSRILWLLLLMFSATLTGTIIANYESAFAVLPVLVTFIPMLMNTGGNCGSQSSTLIIRGIAVDEIQFSDIIRVIWKEVRVALLVSVVLGAANGLRIVIMYRDVKLGAVIALSLIATVVISKVIGCVLPLVAKKARWDPAIMAAPLITTIVDTCSIIIYFSIATKIFAL